MLTDLLTTALDHPGRVRNEKPGEQGSPCDDWLGSVLVT